MACSREAVAFLAAALIPPLGATQVVVAQDALLVPSAWAIVLGIFITSTCASAIHVLTMLNAKAGNPAVPMIGG